LLKEFDGVAARDPPHLLESLDRHQHSQRLAFAFDDELIVAKRHSIQHISETLANIECRNPFCHKHLQVL